MTHEVPKNHSTSAAIGWDRLRHGGLLLDPQRLRSLEDRVPGPLEARRVLELRRRASLLADGSAELGEFIHYVLTEICGFKYPHGSWQRGPQVSPDWTRHAVTGEAVKPRMLWTAEDGSMLPVFFEPEKRVGIGRGRRTFSRVLQWLRAGDEKLALISNGRQWRLVFAGIDFDAWCEWDIDLWFEEGEVSPQVTALRTLLQPDQWTRDGEAHPPLLQAILDSRKGQAELSAVLGERVRSAVEILVQAHGEVLKERCADVDPADIYRAAVRVVMRMVVVLFAESRGLLPRDIQLYHGSYGLAGLLEELEKIDARGGARLRRSWNAWPRVLALFRLVYDGSHHPSLPIPQYGGELFAPGSEAAPDGLTRAVAVFETACFEREIMSDHQVHRMLERITRTRIKVRQGRSSTWVAAPVDFSDLSSEYIGILYEGLLDFELKVAPPDNPIIFLAVGNQPALPLSRLEEMDEKALANLFDKMKDTTGAEEQEAMEAEMAEAEEDESDKAAEESEEDEDEDDSDEEEDEEDTDTRYETRTRAEEWARRAVEIGKLVRKPRGKMTREKRLDHEQKVAKKARQLVTKVILPGEWYLVRWGGTRKGSGTFYTRPGLAVPTVHRTLRPLAFDPPKTDDGEEDRLAPPSRWTPKPPEDILALKVCDPACGSGTFPVAALRFLTDALYTSLVHHERITEEGDRSIIRILETPPNGDRIPEERLGQELLPARLQDDHFEPRLKAILRRYIVERCIYGVDVDPLAAELCRLSLWIETMDRELPFSFLDHKIKVGNSLVGAWFDQFQHYPVMAWKNRDGGDTSHSNGVHFEKKERTDAIKDFWKNRLADDLKRYLSGRTLFDEDLQATAMEAHDDALEVLSRVHEMPVHYSTERARLYREELLGSEAYRKLKSAMDLWCACWFWPADRIDDAPLPTSLAHPPSSTLEVAERLAVEKQFFHWELEFPDVFRASDSGFHALLGNPPWEIAKPNSKEFFSSIDPLYRSYGKQEAIRKQTEYFADEEIESSWLEYNADFRSQSNYMSYAATPFGDPKKSDKSPDRFSIVRGKQNYVLHDRWRSARAKSDGYADAEHPYRHQGSADLNLYKLFLEQTHNLLRAGGRLGFIVPSGLYSDYGTGDLRLLFIERSRWEWLFGFENREKVFDIDSRFKFNPVIIEKGGRTDAIQTAFMRRRLEDWERAEAIATPYTREQVERFSPKSKAILEIQSDRDLEILDKIYANSVLLGDDGPDGWGIEYAREFDMTNDSKLFPPRSKWEAQGYRPDEYSRWLKGNWRPIDQLWEELGVNPREVVPIDPECQAEIESRADEVHRTDWRLRCAQPPYDAIPIPRADIPPGYILSREADAWIHEDEIDDVALPLYEGRIVGQYNSSKKGWVSGKGRGAVWRDVDRQQHPIEPQFLMSRSAFPKYDLTRIKKVGQMRVASATNTRTMTTAALPDVPCGDKVATLRTANSAEALALSALLNTYATDFQTRLRTAGLQVDQHLLYSLAVLRRSRLNIDALSLVSQELTWPTVLTPATWLSSMDFLDGSAWRQLWASTENRRRELIAMIDAVVAGYVGLDAAGMAHLLAHCDHPDPRQTNLLPPKGFWRVDKDKHPEHRQTVLTLIAVHDLDEKIHEVGGDRDAGIRLFLEQNDGEGWMLPETLRLADYGLGHDERAKEHQPVASHFGPRFYDWQLAQTPDESWRECHLHARNMLDAKGYQELLEKIERGGIEKEDRVAEVREEGSQYRFWG